MRRQRRDGGAGLRVWSAEGRQRLVSDQSPRGRGLRPVVEARACSPQCISSRQLRHCHGRARRRLYARRAALRRDPAHVPAAAHSPGWIDRPCVVVGPAASDPQPVESAAGEPHRLVLVRGVADRVRRGRRRGGRPPVADADARERVICRACGHRSAWNNFIARRDTVVIHVRRLAASMTLVATLGIVAGGCGTPPGQPRTTSITPAPRDVVEFDALYADNCAGCHGASGKGGAAIGLANPVYLAIIDRRSMRVTIADGVRGTSMPAFAQRAGGMLTEAQIDVLVDGIRSRWGDPGALAGTSPPSYAPASAGDVQRGAEAYQTFCRSCHGADGQGGPKGSAITNDSFLALTSDQVLRTNVIVGRPELGAPDWRGDAGRPMSNQEVTDVVIWLVAHRVAAPGQLYVE